MSRRKIFKGTALNYIAKLYFTAPTNRGMLLALFNQLKADKITPAIALERANKLVQHG